MEALFALVRFVPDKSLGGRNKVVERASALQHDLVESGTTRSMTWRDRPDAWLLLNGLATPFGATAGLA